MSSKNLPESNRSLTQIWKSNTSTNDKQKSCQALCTKQNRTTTTDDDLVLAPDLFIQITEKKFFRSLT